MDIEFINKVDVAATGALKEMRALKQLNVEKQIDVKNSKITYEADYVDNEGKPHLVTFVFELIAERTYLTVLNGLSVKFSAPLNNWHDVGTFAIAMFILMVAF